MNESHGRNIMTGKSHPENFTATDLRIALNEIYPEATYGAIPVIDQYDALEAYLAFDDGALAEHLRHSLLTSPISNIAPF